jgi:hypothetical protein
MAGFFSGDKVENPAFNTTWVFSNGVKTANP